MPIDSFPTRIFAALAGMLVLLIAAAAVFGEVRIRAFHRAEIEARLRTAAELLTESAGDLLAGRRARDEFQTHLRELGRTALDVLLAQLAPDAKPRREVLSSRLVVRESCGCLGSTETRQEVEGAPSFGTGRNAPLEERAEQVAE